MSPPSEEGSARLVAKYRVQAHYLARRCFLGEAAVLRAASALRGVPVAIVHGEHDWICRPQNAWRVHRACAGSRLAWAARRRAQPLASGDAGAVARRGRCFAAHGDFSAWPSAAETPMSLRLQINLLLAGVIVVFTLAVLAFQIIDTRRSVREETEAANRVATQLLGYLRQHVREDQHADRARIARAPRPRALDRDHAARRRRQRGLSLAAVAVQSRAAMRRRWYSALVSPEPMKSELRFYDSTLTIEANAVARGARWLGRHGDAARIRRARVRARQRARVLARAPLDAAVPRRSSDGLVDVERGAFHTRLPSLAGAEAGKIALAFNRMAGAIEDNLNARAEAADARRRLEQSRELADVVQSRIEDERAHIARELHDETGQNLTAIRSLALSLARREGDDATRADRAADRRHGRASCTPRCTS